MSTVVFDRKSYSARRHIRAMFSSSKSIRSNGNRKMQHSAASSDISPQTSSNLMQIESNLGKAQVLKLPIFRERYFLLISVLTPFSRLDHYRDILRERIVIDFRGLHQPSRTTRARRRRSREERTKLESFERRWLSRSHVEVAQRVTSLGRIMSHA